MYKKQFQKSYQILSSFWYFPILDRLNAENENSNKSGAFSKRTSLNESTTKTKGLLGEARKMVKEIVKANVPAAILQNCTLTGRSKQSGSSIDMFKAMPQADIQQAISNYK